jgi:hypothetical protein
MKLEVALKKAKEKRTTIKNKELAMYSQDANSIKFWLTGGYEKKLIHIIRQARDILNSDSWEIEND